MADVCADDEGAVDELAFCFARGVWFCLTVDEEDILAFCIIHLQKHTHIISHVHPSSFFISSGNYPQIKPTLKA